MENKEKEIIETDSQSNDPEVVIELGIPGGKKKRKNVTNIALGLITLVVIGGIVGTILLGNDESDSDIPSESNEEMVLESQYNQEDALASYKEKYNEILLKKEESEEEEALVFELIGKLVLDHQNQLCLLLTELVDDGSGKYNMHISIYKHLDENIQLLGEIDVEEMNDLDSVLWYASEDKLMLGVVDGLNDNEDRDREWGISDVQEFPDYGTTVYELGADGFIKCSKIYYNQKVSTQDQGVLDFLTLAYNSYGTMNLYKSQWIMGTMSMDIHYNSVLGFSLAMGDDDVVNEMYSEESFNHILDKISDVEISDRNDLVTFYKNQSDLDEIASIYQHSELTYFEIDLFIEDGVKYEVSQVVQEEDAEYGMFYKGNDGLYVTANYLYELSEDFVQANEVQGYAIDAVNNIGALRCEGTTLGEASLVIEEGILAYGESKSITPLKNIELPRTIKNLDIITMLNGDKLVSAHKDYSTEFDVDNGTYAHEYVRDNFLSYRIDGQEDLYLNSHKEPLMAYLDIIEKNNTWDTTLFLDDVGNLGMFVFPDYSASLDTWAKPSYIYLYKNGKIDIYTVEGMGNGYIVQFNEETATVITESWMMMDEIFQYITIRNNEVIENFVVKMDGDSGCYLKVMKNGSQLLCNNYDEYEAALNTFKRNNTGILSTGESQKNNNVEAQYSKLGKKDTVGSSNLSEKIKISNITASSVHEETRANGSIDVYDTKNMIDNDLSTTWAEDMDENTGESFINIELTKSSVISGINISAGYHKTSELYYKNNRPKTLVVEFDNGEIEKFILSDDSFGEEHTIQFKNKQTSKNIKITIRDVYYGSHYNDTCISEINVF